MSSSVKLDVKVHSEYGVAKPGIYEGISYSLTKSNLIDILEPIKKFLEELDLDKMSEWRDDRPMLVDNQYIFDGSIIICSGQYADFCIKNCFTAKLSGFPFNCSILVAGHISSRLYIQKTSDADKLYACINECLKRFAHFNNYTKLIATYTTSQVGFLPSLTKIDSRWRQLGESYINCRSNNANIIIERAVR